VAKKVRDKEPVLPSGSKQGKTVRKLAIFILCHGHLIFLLLLWL